MANYKFSLGRINVGGASVEVAYHVASADASKVVTGLNVGDLCWAVDTGILYVATSSTEWNGQIARTDYVNTFLEQQIFNNPDGIIITNSGVGVTLFHSATASRNQFLPNVNGDLVAVGIAGIPPTTVGDVGRVNATAQAAAIASTLLTKTTAAGLYRISYFLRCTTADVTAGSITASFTYTDNVGATTDVTAAIVLTATTSKVQGSLVVYLASGDITYLTTLTGIAGTSRYQLRARCEYLG